MTLTLVVGIIAALSVTALAVAYQHAPTRARCPVCGGATQAVVAPPWVRRAAPRLQGRWCPSCSWEGLGRIGPELVPGRPVAHDSGFHWGAERLPEDFGFQWRPVPPREPDLAGPPHHPSGFRFAASEEDSSPRHRAHPSGFSWAASTHAGAASAASDTGFVWGESGKRRGQIPFRWKGVA